MFSSPYFFSVATLALAIALQTATLTGAGTLGVSYGMRGDNLPLPREVVDLYKSQGIKGMRIFDPNQEVLQALRGSDIELLLGVPNEDLEQLASNSSCAKKWVQTNVLNYLPEVKIKYIAVGNEVTPVNGNKQYAQFIVPAMTNIYSAVKDAGLCQKVTVTTTLDISVIENTYPPSKAQFKGNVMWFMNPVIRFLTDTDSLIMFSVYPFFAYLDDPNINLSFVLFTNQCPEFTDPKTNLKYYNLFDATLDSIYTALEKASGYSAQEEASGSRLGGVHPVLRAGPKKNLDVATGETGTPHVGWGAKRKKLLSAEDARSIDYACTYNQNLIRHVTSSDGTPLRPGAPIETYMFSMFDENLKEPTAYDKRFGYDYEKHFGLFYPNKTAVCGGINFHGT